MRATLKTRQKNPGLRPAVAADGLSGLQVWFDASTLTDADGTALSTWPDSSGNGNAATSTGTARPLVKTNILNGKRVVRFDGSDDIMTSPYAGTTGTVIAVYYLRSSSGYRSVCHGQVGGGTGPWPSFQLMVMDNGRPVSQILRSKTADVAKPTIGAATRGSLTAWNTFVATIDDSTATVTARLNASRLADTETESVATLKTPTGLVLGAGCYNGPVDFTDLDIAELIIYNRVLSEVEIDRVGRGLAAKWGTAWKTNRLPTSYNYVSAVFAPGAPYSLYGTESAFLLGSNDAQTWDLASDIAINAAARDSVAAGQAVRDPDLYKHTDGYWYMVHTNGSFPANTSTNLIGLLRSPDLLSWQRLPYLTVPSVGSTEPAWAPQFYYSTGSSTLYLIISISSDGTPTGSFSGKVYALNIGAGTLTYSTTIAGTGLPTSMIDSLIVKVGSTYHLVYKNETLGTIEHATSSSEFSGYTVAHSNVFGENGVEGPSLLFMGGTTWRLYCDKYVNTSDRLGWIQSTDNMATWGGTKTTISFVSDQEARFRYNSGTQHGSFNIRV
jgi:hypothetical protein